MIDKYKIQLSAMGNIWKFKNSDNAQIQREVFALQQQYGVENHIAQLMVMRGISEQNVEGFLNPSLKNSLPDPSHLLDMDKATQRICQAITAQEKVAIFGDYDVDGATSSALLVRFFSMVGLKVETYIPDRLTEGYGPNSKALEKIYNEGTKLVITVDCGTVSYEPLAHAAKIGLDVIVIDHHLGGEELPEAIAVVNPNRLDETSEYHNLAAVGVCFLLVVAVNRQLRRQGFYQSNNQPDLLSLLDVVALGTVCDVMTLTGLNRAFVTQGLKIIASRQQLGMRVLGDVARMNGYPEVYHLGFVLGPRINAGGRIGKSDLGTRLLTTNDVDEAYEIAQELDKLNMERKAIEQTVLDDAMIKAQQLDQQGCGFLLIAPDENNYWHPGVIGIVASRIKDRFHKPCAILSIENNIAKASARSVHGVDLGAAVLAARMEGILLGGGGHAMAAGFSIECDRIVELQQYMDKLLSKTIADYGNNRYLNIDMILPLSAITVELVKSFEQLAPYGNGNPEPRFVFEQLTIVKTKIVGENHLMIMLKEKTVGVSSKIYKAMAFRAVGTLLGEAIFAAGERKVDIAGKLKLNSWQGAEKIEIFIDDIRFV